LRGSDGGDGSAGGAGGNAGGAGSAGGAGGIDGGDGSEGGNDGVGGGGGGEMGGGRAVAAGSRALKTSAAVPPSPMPTTARKAMKMLSRWDWQRRPGPQRGESSEGFLARFLGERGVP